MADGRRECDTRTGTHWSRGTQSYCICCTAFRAMDDDGDDDSQSELEGSLSWWMMKSLWREDGKLRLLLADTTLLQDGHIMHWLFTSSKSGRVLKRSLKHLDWDALITFLIRRARSGRGNKRSKDVWERPAEIIATARKLREGKPCAMLLTMLDLKSLREKHNAHLLDQIIAIQPFVARNPFAGCGLFETEFERKGRSRTAPAALSTYELLQWPEDIKWFDDFEQPRVDSGSVSDTRGENDSAERGRRNGSAKRMHGVLHRMLATTTKQIVEYVEHKTQEIVLRVVAQFAFTPGSNSGQPILLWLDSIKTVRSTQQSNNYTPVRSIDPDSKFMQLTHELVERSRPWTTFFPPKIGELSGRNVSPGLAGFNLSTESRPSDLMRACMKPESSPEVDANATTYALQASGGTCGLLDASGGAVRDKCNAKNKGVPDSLHAATDRESDEADRTGDQGENTTFGDNKRGGLAVHDNRSGNSYFPARGGQWGHFTLPTESWIHRSAESRGNFFTLAGDEEGRAARSLNECLPRKRSTGTTMRGDGPPRRSDLVDASENRRPSTSPVDRARRLEGGVLGAGGEGSYGETTSCRLSRGSKGCFGDYCHLKVLLQGKSTRGSDDQTDTRGGRYGTHAEIRNTGVKADKMVSYRSILKSRAEEKALSNTRIQGRQTSGRDNGAPERLPVLGFGDSSGYLEQEQSKPALASLITKRMHTLAASLTDEGCGQFFSLASSNRAKAGVPESAERAVEELLYEEVLSHLYPTTVSRAVNVCDTCAMVYGCMDTCRKQAKEIKAASREITRLARIEVSRRLRQRSRQPTVTRDPQASGSPLRRYSNLNLGSMPAPCPGRAAQHLRPTTTDGNHSRTYEKGTPEII